MFLKILKFTATYLKITEMDDLLNKLKIEHPTTLITVNEIDLNNLNFR